MPCIGFCVFGRTRASGVPSGEPGDAMPSTTRGRARSTVDTGRVADRDPDRDRTRVPVRRASRSAARPGRIVRIRI